LASQRRQLESTITAMQSDLDEAVNELKNSEERSKKATADASRVVEQLREEQERSAQIERARKALEQQVKEVQSRFDDAGNSSVKDGKRLISKLEQHVRK
ncbi:unnamed protein product, partial [Rotaria magnacalcarata]